MAVQAKERIGKCRPCLAFKARQPKAPLKNIVAPHPLELVLLDFLCLEPGKGREENVLVITDHFTRYTQAYVTRTQMAQTMAKTLWDKFIVHYGLPKKILTDQGRNFESQLVADLCALMGVQKIQTSPYRLQTNGQCGKIQFHSDQYAWDITQGKEVRVEGSCWNIGPCVQLHSKFSHGVQPLLSHVW